MAENVHQVQLRRTANSQPWGFRMRGGAQQGMPLYIEAVNPKGRSAAMGLCAGDVILMIGRADVRGYTHDQAKSEMLRAGNELDFTVQRGVPGIPVGPSQPPPQRQAGPPRPQPQEPRSEVVEEPIMKLGGPTYKEVKPKTYQVLQEQLPACEAGAQGAPSSIFNRKKEDRSAYLQASGPTIQKAYGQSH